MIDWRTLPSLAALRAFEAAARTGSLSAAARELNVTHAAIAQHVRALESHFQLALLTRSGAGMTSTPEGSLLAAALTEGLQAIAEGCHRLSDLTAARPLAVSCTPSFAENWLMPRIATFWTEHPEVDVTILPSNRVIDFRAERIDIAIRYTRGNWPCCLSEPLLTEDFIVTAAPSHPLQCDPTCITDLQDQLFLMNITHAEHHTLARDLGLDPDRTEVRMFATNGLVLAAARAGLGLAVQSRALAARDLESGALREVIALQAEGLGYWMVHPQDHDTERLRLFKRWLRSQAQTALVQ